MMAYNVENLFDTLHCAGRNDLPFTPKGEMAWSGQRYWGKLGKLARVIAACGGEQPAAVVALCEVENDSVVYDLTRRTMLGRLGYEFVMTKGVDRRGMNVALLYQPLLFRPLKVECPRIPFNERREQPTRDLLHVTGELTNGDTLDVIVCHWPSRRGGVMATNGYRQRAAAIVRARVDALLETRQRPQVVITGDLNAFYPEACIKKVLRAEPPKHSKKSSDNELYILTHKLVAANGMVEGTYKFQGKWNQLDHFIINGALLEPPKVNSPKSAAQALETNSKPLFYRAGSCKIAAFPFLLKRSRKDGMEVVAPKRLYGGSHYMGGFSDHLPIVMDLYYR